MSENYNLLKQKSFLDYRVKTKEFENLDIDKQKDGNKCSYQVFIEPKGEHLMEKDRWKEDFLKKLGGLYKADMQPLDVDTEKYVVVGVSFYNHEQEKDFVSDFNEIV